ncbi:50S ribosomal protein L35Ae [Candidatus Tiddalikarchaeum anstoanum]|nr:50S ribosomal protein L35Ae [Candidatus Tiddalikarchaeum anstoanum]
MKGVIVSYRRGKCTQTNNQMLVLPEDVKKSKDLIGKKVVYKTKTHEIVGKVTKLHGVKGVVRVLFETGMPGQSLRKEVIIE